MSLRIRLEQIERSSAQCQAIRAYWDEGAENRFDVEGFAVLWGDLEANLTPEQVTAMERAFLAEVVAPYWDAQRGDG